MRTFLSLLLIFHLLCGYSQQKNTAPESYSVAFQKSNKLFLQEHQSQFAPLELKDFSVVENNIWNENVLVHFPEDISQNLVIKEGWVLYSGIQSPYDKNIWLCLERTVMGIEFNLFLFNSLTGERQLFIDNNNSMPQYAFRPVCWSADKNITYLERIQFDNGYDHEGIYSFNLSSKELKKLSVTDKYMSTPVLSPDKNLFLYTATTNETRELVHGMADKILVYSLQDNQERIISEEKQSPHTLLGWYVSEPFIKNSHFNFKTGNTAQISFRLPWVSGLNYCVTRDGSVSAPGFIGSSSVCSDLGQHSYPAATDFDTPNNADHKVLAVAAGTVTSVVYSTSGYGNCVIVTHADNYRTRYAHNKSIAVTQGQVVQQGCYLAIEGNTGNSFGDHIHFEYETPGGASNVYATFSDCGGCVPHRGYAYTSINSIQPCSPSVATPPPPTITSNVTCGNKTISRSTPPAGTTYYWQGTACGTSMANSSVNYVVSTSGSYKLRARSSAGIWSSSCSSISVTINQVPPNPPLPTVSTNSCGPKTLTRAIPPSGRTYFWQTLCGTNTASSSLTYNAVNSGTYRLRARTTAGCWSPTCAAVSVTVNTIPSPNITGQNSVCNNAIGIGYSVSNSGNNFAWSINGGTITAGQNTNSVTVNWGTSSSGTLAITEANPMNGCAKTVSLNVSINSSLNPSIFASGPISFCQGDSVILDASFGYTSYLWNTGATTQTISVANSGTYAVSVNASNGCTGYSSNPATVTVNPPPPTPTISVNNTTLTSSSNSGNQWYLNGVIITGETSPTISINQNGYYSVLVTDSVTGCSSQSNSFFFGAVGITESSKEEEIKIYPNPSDGTFTTEINIPFVSSKIIVRDVLGRCVYMEEIKNASGEINLRELPKGIYFVQLLVDEANVTKKLILK